MAKKAKPAAKSKGKPTTKAKPKSVRGKGAPVKLTSDQALAIVVAAIQADLPGAAPKPGDPLSKYGYDAPASLILRDKIYKACGVFISDEDMLACSTIADVAAQLVKASKGG